MKKVFKIICLIQILIVPACNQEEPGIDMDKTGLIYQVYFDSELYYEYTYNGTNQIFEEKSKLHYTKHNYDGSRLISSDYYYDPGMVSSSSILVEAAMNRKEWVNPKNTEKNSTKTYFYDNFGTLVKSLNYLGTCEFSYDDRNRMIRQTFFDENRETGYMDYLYDQNDNVIKKLHYWILTSGQPELQTTTEYVFDNMVNPYKAFNALGIPGEYTNRNNIIKETYMIHFEVDKSVQKVQIIENVYKYNMLGYPVSKNGNVTFKYY